MIRSWALLASVAFLASGVACALDDGAAPGGQTLHVLEGEVRPHAFDALGSLKFAVIGDSGRWSGEQRDTAAQLVRQHEQFPFDLVLMLGDNNYGDGSTESYRQRFEIPYAPLLARGVTFHAVLGNHDPPQQERFGLFNMGGHRYYAFSRKAGALPSAMEGVQFFALDTVTLDDDQIVWLDQQLARSKADWKIVFMHHPLYTSGRYGWAAALRRRTLETPLVEHAVDVVLAGHEHVYERHHLQRGVLHLTAGASGSVRVGDLEPGTSHAAGYDADLTFMLIEIAGDTLHFRAVNRVGKTVDAGRVVKKRRGRD